MMTFKEAKATLRSIGYSLRYTGYGDELRAAPLKGTREEKENVSYYSTDIGDIVASVMYQQGIDANVVLATTPSA